MKSQILDSANHAVVQLENGAYWIRLALEWAGEFTGGELVRFAPDATVCVEGADELASSYDRTNWISGVASGALYAFRAFRIPRRQVIVTELSGHLRASDMDAVADACSTAIAELAGREEPALPREGWTFSAQDPEESRTMKAVST